MNTFNKIMYVVDPTTTSQMALGRVIDGVFHLGAVLHIYVCVPPPAEAAEKPDMIDRLQSRLDSLAQTARERGVEVTTEVEVSADWASAIAPAAKRWGADMIVKALHPHTAMQRRLRKTGAWTLMRSAECPILFVKEDSPSTPQNLVAAVDLANQNPRHQQLMKDVIRHARGICETTGAQLHVANAYTSLENSVEPIDLAHYAEVERRYAHVGQGSPEELLQRVASKLDGPVIVIGSSDHRSFTGKVLGNSAELILDKSPKDILIILAPHEERLAA